MVAPSQRALVVDDEAVIRALLSTMLRQHGVACDQAGDGNEAVAMLAQTHYDVIVTDLRMPNMHGHALVTDILARPDRPIIIVHTGVVEPKLAKDLLSRGVDDIVFKPTDLGLLAAKVKVFLDRRPPRIADSRIVEPDHALSSARGKPSAVSRPASPPAFDEPQVDRPIALPELSRQLAGVAVVLPISATALDVYNMSRDCTWELSQLAAAIQRDASLTAEVLRLANSSLYNASNRQVVDLDEAILRIGQRRVGEVALTASALAAATPETLPWMDLELVWKRSMAAGIALESLIDVGRHSQIEDGLLLSAIMHPLGRVVLGMLFPRHYDAMIRACGRDNEALQTLERRLLPMNYAELMAHLLGAWHIPSEVCLPLKHLLDDYSSLVRVPEPVRTRAELVKVAVLAGRLAINRWESWDWIHLTPPSVMKRLRLDDLGTVITQTRADLGRLADFRPGGAPSRTAASAPPARPVPYCDLNEGGFDLLAELLPAMGLCPVPCPPEELKTLDQTAIVNCLGVQPTKLAAIRAPREKVVAVVARDKREVVGRFAKTAALPASFGSFRHELLTALDPAPPVELHRELAGAGSW